MLFSRRCGRGAGVGIDTAGERGYAIPNEPQIGVDNAFSQPVGLTSRDAKETMYMQPCSALGHVRDYSHKELSNPYSTCFPLYH
jgi:hypothetical protein